MNALPRPPVRCVTTEKLKPEDLPFNVASTREYQFGFEERAPAIWFGRHCWRL